VNQQPPRPPNRRAALRKKPKGARCRCRQGALGLGPDLALALLDLSQTGARLLVKSALPLKQPVELELYGVAYPKTVRIEALVVHCAPTQEGAYHVGVRFERYLPYPELVRLT
jgi:hypothetical protein